MEDEINVGICWHQKLSEPMLSVGENSIIVVGAANQDAWHLGQDECKVFIFDLFLFLWPTFVVVQVQCSSRKDVLVGTIISRSCASPEGDSRLC